MTRKISIVILILAILTASGVWYARSSSDPQVSFRTVAVERGDLLATISATGTIEPEEVIDVGAQVAGQILSFGDDPRGIGKPVNYGTPVEKGTVLARIDESLYRTQVDRARAMVEQAQAQLESSEALVAQAEANVQRAEADLKQLQAKLDQTTRDLQRVRKARPGSGVTETDYDIAENAFLTSKAALGVGDATIAQTKAALMDARANVKKSKGVLSDALASFKNAEINLGYCTIKSPVKGVIIDRRVNVGQTVVSSLNAPSLFLIAKDLKRLEVWASVNEADIGNIYSGQPVTFTVDAYPGRTFKGTVAPDQPRLNASMTQNVVTYTAVVTTENLDGKLKPYMTANLQFEVSKRSNVLQVPNSALRWKPRPERVAPEERGDYVSSQRLKRPNGEDSSAAAEKESHHRGVLWVQDGDYVRPVKVVLGVTDGLRTEIVEGGVEEGTAVVVGESRAAGAADASNPFTPKMFGGKK